MSSHSHDQLVSKKAGPLLGIMPIPGDKSISHRALIFGSLAIGTTKVSGLLEGADVMSTKDALVALGAGIDRDADGPSFYRAQIFSNPTWWDRFSQRVRCPVIGWLQDSDPRPRTRYAL